MKISKCDGCAYRYDIKRIIDICVDCKRAYKDTTKQGQVFPDLYRKPSKCDGCKYQFTESDEVVYDICLKCRRGFREGTEAYEERVDKYERKE